MSRSARTPTTPAGRRLTARGVAAFLAALAETGMVGEAAARAGVPRASLYRKKAADPDFAAAWATALEAGLDGLRDEAVRRARDGVEETVWHRGEPVGTRRRYSDQLLMFLLRAHQPALYREPRGNAPAEEKEEKVDELSEILALINGKTRTIHAMRMQAKASDAADDAEDDPDGPDDRPDAAGNDTGDAETADAAGDDRAAAEPVARPAARPSVYVPVEEPAFVRPGRTAGLDYDPLNPYPRDPP